jgi:Cu(I)/Ag(I) efflux system membrane fusion protein
MTLKAFSAIIFAVLLSLPAYAQNNGAPDEHLHQTSKTSAWTCSMHPHIHLPKPGKCPICHMDLIPLEMDSADDTGEDTPGVKLTERAASLMEIRTSKVERRMVSRSVRLVGKIDYDETRVKHITAWVPGRIERMFVDYTGIEVRANDHMVSIYSPELVSSQEELVQAARALGRIDSGSEMVKRSSKRSLQAAREKLKLLGLNAAQVAQIERRGKAEDTVTVYSPIGGTVVQKNANEGMYVQTGSRIYTIADLSHLWLNLDAYESDLPWIGFGQEVEFSAEAAPGDVFSGVVSFVQPILDERTRTIKVRVNVDNKDERLKPGMFVTAKIKAQINSEGKLITASYAGKYLCPMHPEVVTDSAGSCPVCGMDLVKAEKLPFVGTSHQHNAKAPVVVPASAPLITGTRAVVYVKDPHQMVFKGREVVLGPRADEYYLVKSGLNEGELVVTNGAFKLDADLQIKGASSMMNPDGGKISGGHQH